jgi:hypothetical protein
MFRFHKKTRLRATDFLIIGLGSSLITLILVLACVFIIWLAYSSFLTSLASNTPIATQTSPDGLYQAVAFLRCEGAWGGCTQEVSILNSGNVLPNADANVFIGGHSGSVDILWLGERTLLIRYHSEDDPPSLQEAQFGDVTIQYELMDPE